MNITAEEAKRIMDTEEGYIILDVRTQEEYDEGHIPGAILIPNTEIEARHKRVQWSARNEPAPSGEVSAGYHKRNGAASWQLRTWWSWAIPTSRSSAASSTGPMRWNKW